jgi:hypothetical protein
LEVRRIRSGASRDRHEDVVWLAFMAQHRHLVDGTVTSARTTTHVPHIGACFPLPGSLALGTQRDKLDRDLRTFAWLGMPSVQSLHYYYPFALEDGWRLAHMADDMAGRLVVLVAVRRFLGMAVAHSRSLRFDSYVRMQHFVRRSTYASFRRFWGDVPLEFITTSFSYSSWYFGFLSP